MPDNLRPKLSDFVASKSNLIRRHAAVFAAEIAEFQRNIGRRDDSDLIDDLHHHVEQVLLTYTPPSTNRAGDSLVFAHLYDDAEATSSTAGAELTRSTILSALLAAEVEFRGPLRLSHTQNSLLADVYENLGTRLLRARLPAHAAFAFDQAAHLYSVNEDVRGQDRCGLAQARARTLAANSLITRVLGRTSDTLCGYGYRPFRLLVWLAVEILGFSLAVVATAKTGVSVADCLYLGTVSFLNPLGLGDVAEVGATTKVVLAVESYAGIVSTSVFFALLVRKLFRL